MTCRCLSYDINVRAIVESHCGRKCNRFYIGIPIGVQAISRVDEMNIIVVGAGRVGFTIAEVLSEFHNVLVIDSDKEAVEQIKRLNVSVLHEDGASPRTLEDAFSRHSPHVVISTTERDDINLFISMLTKYIRPGTRTVARITNPEYMVNTSESMVDHVFSPEMIIANKMAELALLENAMDYESIESMDMGLAIFEVTPEHGQIIGKVIINLPIPPDCTVVCLYRDEEIIIENETVEIHPHDRICVIGNPEAIHKFNEMMGILRDAMEFVIIGGGVSGIQTARLLSSKNRYVKVIESNPEKCSKLARELSNVTVLNGSGIDPHMLKEVNVSRADVLIANTSKDETNLLSCLMGMKLGTSKIISRYSMIEYEDIFDITGINTAIGAHRIVANEITKMLVSDEDSILKMKHKGEMFFSVNVTAGVKICNERLGDIRMPEGARIVCIIRGEMKIYPNIDTKIIEGDKVLLFTYNVNIRKLERQVGHINIKV